MMELAVMFTNRVDEPEIVADPLAMIPLASPISKVKLLFIVIADVMVKVCPFSKSMVSPLCAAFTAACMLVYTVDKTTPLRIILGSGDVWLLDDVVEFIVTSL